IRKAQVKDGTASRGNVCVVGAVGFVVVGLVGQVQHVKLCAQVLAEAIGSHGVKAPVRRNFQLVCRVSVLRIDIIGTCAQGQLGGGLVGRPQAEAVARRIGEVVAIVGGCGARTVVLQFAVQK